MKPTNLLALSQGFKTVPASLLPSFEAQLSEREEPLDAVKEHEARSVTRLTDELHAHGATSPRHFEGFAFSFRIPQISSEFDLLKICDGAVVDIELKIEDVGEERIERQLTRNRYYLAPLERTTYTFTYVVDEDMLYEMGEDGVLVRTSLQRLVQVLGSLGRPYEGRVEDLFKASNYLVSPLNDTDRFLAGSYFLTNHQAQIKASFRTACREAAGQRPVVFLVYGSAGTGKSLLLYDLAKSLDVAGPACILHCGLLSEGHELLPHHLGQGHGAHRPRPIRRAAGRRGAAPLAQPAAAHRELRRRPQPAALPVARPAPGGCGGWGRARCRAHRTRALFAGQRMGAIAQDPHQ